MKLSVKQIACLRAAVLGPLRTARDGYIDALGRRHAPITGASLYDRGLVERIDSRTYALNDKGRDAIEETIDAAR